jgi:hypothetical protein
MHGSHEGIRQRQRCRNVPDGVGGEQRRVDRPDKSG